MNTRTTPTRRPGRPAFTVIEILVVIAIITVLAGLLLGALMKMRNVPPHKNTETLILKLMTVLDQQWEAVRDQARRERIPAASYATLLTQAGGDQDAARNLWIQYRLAQEFPASYAEATAPAFLQPKPEYVQALQGGGPPAATVSGNSYESGICLFLALVKVNRGGMEFHEGDLSATDVKKFNTGLSCLVDGWGEPLRFMRTYDANGNLTGYGYEIRSAGQNRQMQGPSPNNGDDLTSTALRLSR